MTAAIWNNFILGNNNFFTRVYLQLSEYFDPPRKFLSVFIKNIYDPSKPLMDAHDKTKLSIPSSGFCPVIRERNFLIMLLEHCSALFFLMANCVEKALIKILAGSAVVFLTAKTAGRPCFSRLQICFVAVCYIAHVLSMDTVYWHFRWKW